MRRTRDLAVLLLLFGVVLGFAAASPPKDSGKPAKPEDEPFGRLTVTQVERRLGKPGVFVFDGNSPDVYAENHVPGATRIYHDDVKPGALPADKDATLIFYCMSLL